MLVIGVSLFTFHPSIYKELMSSITFCHPATLQFLIAAIFFVIDCKAGAKTCTNCLNYPALTLFERNWYIWLHSLRASSPPGALWWKPQESLLAGQRLCLLWVNLYANEQQCKQWHHNECTYKKLTLLGG